MKLVSFSINGKKSYGELNGDFVVDAPAEVLKTYVDVSDAANINELKYLFEQFTGRSKNRHNVYTAHRALP